MENMKLFDRVVPSLSFDRIQNPWTVNRRTGVWGKVNMDLSKEMIFGNVDVSISGEPQYGDVVEKNHRLYFAPAVQTEDICILVYDLSSKTEERIPLRQFPIRSIKKRDFLFNNVLTVKNYVFFLGAAYPAIVRLNTKTNEVDYITDWLRYIDLKKDELTVMGFFGGLQYGVEDEYLFLPCSMISGVLKLNVETLEEEFLEVDSGAQGLFGSLIYDDERYLISCCGANSNRLILWNKTNNHVEKTVPLQNASSIYPISFMLRDEKGKIYLFPSGALNNGETQDMEIYCMSGNDFNLENMEILKNVSMSIDEIIVGNMVMYATWKSEKSFIFTTGADADWYEYEIDSKELRKFEIELSSGEVEKSRMDFYRKCVIAGIPIDEKKLSIDDFLNL